MLLNRSVWIREREDDSIVTNSMCLDDDLFEASKLLMGFRVFGERT